jgi:hypothetical protein
MREKEPARQTAGAAGVWAVLRVEKPIVGAKRPVKPQGMIEARDLEAGVEHRMTMRAERGAKKSHVGEIREHRAMDGRIAGERSRRAQPDLLFEGARLVPDITGQIDGTDLDGAVLGKPAAHGVRHGRTKAPQHFRFGRQALRQWNLGHRNSVFEPSLLDLERRRERENRASVLYSVAAPRCKTLPVPNPIDFIDDRHGGIAKQKKIAMQRMRRPSFDGAGRGDEGLRDHKAAEHVSRANLGAAPAKNIFLDPFEIENSQKLSDGMRHGSRDFLSRSIS